MRTYTEQEIIIDWINHNYSKLPVFKYPKEIYDFIESTCSMCLIDGNKVYNVNGIWQVIWRIK